MQGCILIIKVKHGLKLHAHYFARRLSAQSDFAGITAATHGSNWIPAPRLKLQVFVLLQRCPAGYANRTRGVPSLTGSRCDGKQGRAVGAVSMYSTVTPWPKSVFPANVSSNPRCLMVLARTLNQTMI